MYESHFGFSSPPFQLNPDPEFYFDSAGHSKALSYLRYGVQQGEGFIVITGDIGAGKTTLVRALMQELNPDEVVAAQVANTQLDAFDLLQSILTAFGVPTEGMGKARLIATLEAFLTAVAASGRRALLVVDEAQNLGRQAIEELRMLSNFQLGHHSLLQSFLVGQPELRLQLQTGAMEQLRQRVLASYHLGPLNPEETAAYVEHRLRHVGWQDRPHFDTAAFALLHRRTGGIPRRLNTLCNRILLAAYLNDLDVISARLVTATADDLQQEMQASGLHPADAASGGHGGPQAAAPAEVASGAAASGRSESSREAPEPVDAMGDDGRAVPSSPSEAQPATAAPDAVRAPVKPAVAIAAVSAVRPLPVTSAVVPLPALAAPVQTPAPAQTAPASADYDGPQGAVLCVADSALAWFKLRSLSRRWAADADLPPMVLVHPGSRATLQRSWQHQVETGTPVPEVHLAVGPGPAGQTNAAVALRFADLMAEARPAAVLVCGASYAVLQCGLMARQLGVPVVRLEAGSRRGDVDSGLGPLHALLDRCADLLTVDSAEEHGALEAEGFSLRQIATTGNLTGSVLRELEPLLPTFSELIADLGAPRDWLARAAAGFGVISAQFQDGDVAPGDALQWLMLARNGSAELPLLWPVSERTATVMRDPSIQLQLQASGIAVVRSDDYFQQLGLLTRARCIVAGPARALIEEASAWQVPSIVVQLYADAVAAPEGSLVTQVGPSASQFRAAVRLAYQALRTDRTAAAADGDAAVRTVSALSRWLMSRAPSGAQSVLDEAAA
jgi:general secretion pathway protein A